MATTAVIVKFSFAGARLPPATRSLSPVIVPTPRAVEPISASISSSSPPYNLTAFKFSPIKESIVSREMTRRYMTDMITYADTDVAALALVQI